MLIKSPMKKEKVKSNRGKRRRDRKKNISTKTFRSNRVYGKKIKPEEKKKRVSLPSVKPWKVITGALVLGIFGILYLSHVFATQQLLREVQQLEREYNQAKRLNNDYQLTYDRLTGPAEIYEKAKSMGFINGGPAERIIEVEK